MPKGSEMVRATGNWRTMTVGLLALALALAGTAAAGEKTLLEQATPEQQTMFAEIKAAALREAARTPRQ